MLKIVISSLLLISGSSLAAEIIIHQNTSTQSIHVADHARLADAYKQIQFANNINWNAALLSNPVLTIGIKTQQNDVIRELNALLATDIEHHQELVNLVQYLTQLPVAGRIKTRLDPDWLLDRPSLNRPLVGHYDLYTSTYPDKISVIGLTQQKDVSPIDLAKVHDYLKLIPSDKLANPGYAYLIAPDGSVSKAGVEIWNRKEDQTVMPGSVIFVGLDTSNLPDSYQTINERIVAVLANRIPK